MVNRTFDVKHEGKQYSVTVRELLVELCKTCNSVTLGSDSDDQIDAALREHLGLLTPERIRENRKSLGLTQAQLAEFIGCASESLSRWESGALVQSRGADRLLRAYFALPPLRAFFAAVESDRLLGWNVVQAVQWATTEPSVVNDPLLHKMSLPQSSSTARVSQVARKRQSKSGISPSPCEYPRKVRYDEAA